MKIENIPADIKSKSLKEARDEINEILANLESKNLDLSNAENAYKRLLNLNKHVENLFKMVFIFTGYFDNSDNNFLLRDFPNEGIATNIILILFYGKIRIN